MPSIIGVSAQSSSDPAFRVRLELAARGLTRLDIAMGLLSLFDAEEARTFRMAGIPARAHTLIRARSGLRRRLRRLPSSVDTVVVQRQVDLMPTFGLERQAAQGRRLVYDVDDAVWLTGRQTGGNRLAMLKGAARKVRWLAERADQIIAGNEHLAEYLGRYSASIAIVPSLIDLGDHDVRSHRETDLLTLGWIGSPTTAQYLHGLRDTLARFVGQTARPVRLLVVGADAPDIPGAEVIERPWDREIERRALAEIDIGLMPLEDTPWARGKCAYKALQYMASGIPPMVDDVGVSAAVVSGAGWVAATRADWVDGLHTLAEDPELRRDFGRAGRARVEADYSLDAWAPSLARLVRGS